MPPPPVSIGLPVLNGENFLDQAICAIREQTYEAFELIVSDNCSTDRTPAIIAKHAAADPRIRSIRLTRTIPPAAHFTRVFEMSRGRFFKWSAHDDLITPHFLERCVAALSSTERAVAACPRSVFIDFSGTVEHTLPREAPMRYSRYSPELLDRVRASLHTGYCHEIFGLFDAEVLRGIPSMGAYPNADGVMLLEIALRGKFLDVPEPMLMIRRHAEQSTALPRKASAERVGGGPRVYASWWTGGLSRGVRFPHWRISWEFGAALIRAPIGTLARLASLRALLIYVWVHRREHAGDLVEILLGGLRRITYPPTRGPKRPPPPVSARSNQNS